MPVVVVDVVGVLPFFLLFFVCLFLFFLIKNIISDRIPPEKLRKHDHKDDRNITWKIFNAISGQNNRPNRKVKKRDGSAPSSDNNSGESNLLSN